ncbi:MAG: 6-carboxytetrahydropterin synthase [Gammaproteobacteria bacterium]|nr:6-carboxytetrahydropterin synthase [Gammaproteobacteria bacterium]
MATLFVEQISVVDCALLDAEAGLLGASWIVDAELEGDLDRQGMVEDFGPLKRRLKQALDALVDHRLLVPRRHPGLWLAQHDGRLALHFDGPVDGAIEHHSPPAAVAVLDAERIDAGTLTEYLQARLALQDPPTARLRLQLRAEAIDGAAYRYVHGLRQHDGPCQRIAHGHRSRLSIWTDGQRDRRLETGLAKAWHRRYLGRRDDLLHAAGGRLRFGYRAGEGAFELELPASRCALLDAPTTVENLAALLAAQAAPLRPGRRVRVRAYEGVQKGAVAEAGPVQGAFS